MNHVTALPRFSLRYMSLLAAPCHFQVRESSGADPSRGLHTAIAHLRDLVPRLRLTRAVISVCVVTLRHQNADFDADVADVLQRYAGDPLSVDVEHLEALVRRLSRPQQA